MYLLYSKFASFGFDYRKTEQKASQIIIHEKVTQSI